ncbi:Sterol 3-beta-glucosyltransferase UGT80A2 [Psilocybe cubensis]|uniref:Sterol 3-beta-glucosyltransferase UGT80A2 n=2 Tax=Psilocybe cubensis TaxID=181762 RepID=A0ACB8H6K1_PSICU|nr:Sterol 3-beta-glucosyltransferase UGT80A2 [Psilocybe cubensis]KAH9483618.1 Sterol 3-beta-glucosyltransferase UGT80A2 [Psilocybe cubensis]
MSAANKEPLHMQINAATRTRPSAAESPLESTTVDYAKYVSQGKGLDSVARVSPDGRISLLFDFKDSKLPEIPKPQSRNTEEFAIDPREWQECPSINIVIMIVGSRGDVQPYVALGKQLLKDGHRVRIATHETFRTFVGDAGLEFYSIGGNPQDLMSYMVKNPGLMPGFESLTNGDIAKKRKMLAEMIDGCWDACHTPCPVTGRSFIADAIISNPPTFAHVHCAEALGIPLLLSFTMPWTATTAFAHPLVNITNSNAGFGVTNYLSYAAADLLTWQGVGDIINTFRTSKLGLSPLGIRVGPGYVDRLKIPWTYCMSPALVPKPDDWKSNIDVSGFYFLDLATNYQPSPELLAFLSAGETPVYIGFGSVVVDDPAEMTEIIFEATKQAGVRALVSSGWGGLGGISVPPHIFILGNVPHDWLFDEERVSAVVHHGGAGTTAIGLAKGRPTVVVPFFGDQGFWGNMIHKAGAGPKPIPHKELSVHKLRDAITFAVSPAAKEAAKAMAQKIYEDDGVRKGVESFYRHLPLLNMRCDLDPSRVAIWWSDDLCLKLSALAAQTLADAKLISLQTLKLHRPKEYKVRKKVADPMTGAGGANAMFWTLTNPMKFGSFLQGQETPPPPGILDAMATVHDGLRRHSADQRLVQSPEYFQDSIQSVFETNKEVKKSSIFESKGFLRSLKNLLPGSRPSTPKSPKSPTPKSPTPNSGSSFKSFMMPVQGSWRFGLSASGKTQYQRQRLTRIAEGRKAVKASTDDQRATIIRKFKEELRNTPARQKAYREAEERATHSGSVDYGHSKALSLDQGKSLTRQKAGWVGAA